MRKTLLTLLVACPLYAALPSATTWEVRTTGVDTNGGCFVAGQAGTDYSQQAAAQYAFTDLVVSAGNNLIVTSASHNFVAADVGNCIHITAGASWTVGFYQIVSASATQATLDRSPAVVNTTGGTWAEGGALLVPQTAVTNFTSGNTAWVQTGTYTETATLALSVAGPTHPSSSSPGNKLYGYGSARGDTGRFTLILSGSTLSGITASTASWFVSNVNMNCNSQTASTGVTSSASIFTFRNSKVYNCLTKGLTSSTGGVQVEYSEFTANSGASVTLGASTGFSRLSHSWIHDNTATGVITASNVLIFDNVISNNTGGSTDGIAIGNSFATVINNTIYGSGRDGINCTNTIFDGVMIRNNVIANSAAWGIMGGSSVGKPADQDWDGNAFYNNTSGNRSNMDDTTTNPVYASGAYVNSLDVTTPAVSPFVNAAGNDFTLNSAATGGALLRATGTPGTITGLGTRGYIDFGVFQSQVGSTACSVLK